MATEVVPPIQALKAKYPTPYQYDHDALYKEFGMVAPKGEEWQNTCAVRMSYCLLRCDINVGKEPGRGNETLIRGGSHRGKRIWLSRRNLTKQIEKIFGIPTYTSVSATKDKQMLESKIGTTGGIISYGKLAEERTIEGTSEAYPGGHIDVVYFDDGWIWDGYGLMIGHDFDMMFRRAEEIKFWRSGGDPEPPQDRNARGGSRRR